MIVDDNDDNRFTLSMRLESCGYSNLLTAENALGFCIYWGYPLTSL